MKKSSKNRLNIFVDETGEFGFGKGSAKLYGVSLVFHEQKSNIDKELRLFDQKINNLGFHDMIHMGDLVTGHGSFAGMTIAERRKIYNCLYRFATQIKAKYHTIIIDKKNAKNNSLLSRLIRKQFQMIVEDNLDYFQKFDQIIVYYDGGQKPLNRIINGVFGKFHGYEQKPDFDHVEKKLFQVADMLTYVDKTIYKYERNIKFAKTEATFFDLKTVKNTVRGLSRRRFKSK